MQAIKIQTPDGSWKEIMISNSSYNTITEESKPEFKVGDWVTRNEWGDVYRVEKVNDGSVILSNNYQEDYDEGIRTYPNNVRHATSEEIKEHLTKEFNKRRYSGKYIEILVGFHKGEISNEPLGSILYYNIRDDRLNCSTENTSYTVYKDGKWAKIVNSRYIDLSNGVSAYVYYGTKTITFNPSINHIKDLKRLKGYITSLTFNDILKLYETIK